MTRGGLRSRLVGAAGLATLLLSACSRGGAPHADDASPPPPSSTDLEPAEPAPRTLYLPDGGDVAPRGVAPTPPPPPSVAARRCPPEMVDIRGSFCIDRWEVSLVRADDGRPLSPYFAPTRNATQRELRTWTAKALTMGSETARALPVPQPPAWQLSEDFQARAVSQVGVVPNGYLSGVTASQVCTAAGKRLCSAAEWVTACRGQANRKFPYGDRYEQGRCNVFREAHPAALLHDDPSIGHLDPRLNLVRSGKQPLLRLSGATPDCDSQWGDDHVADMVGNLDEWVEDDKGAFQGGFYARSTREGCDSRITAHPREYLDYSLGTRCCR